MEVPNLRCTTSSGLRPNVVASQCMHRGRKLNNVLELTSGSSDIDADESVLGRRTGKEWNVNRYAYTATNVQPSTPHEYLR